jgi:large subunit ribosomal protein L1
MAHGKKYLEAAKLVDREQIYSPEEAAQLVKDTSFVAFDATV